MKKKTARSEEIYSWVKERLDAQDRLIDALAKKTDILADMVKDIIKIIKIDEQK